MLFLHVNEQLKFIVTLTVFMRGLCTVNSKFLAYYTIHVLTVSVIGHSYIAA